MSTLATMLNYTPEFPLYIQFVPQIHSLRSATNWVCVANLDVGMVRGIQAIVVRVIATCLTSNDGTILLLYEQNTSPALARRANEIYLFGNSCYHSATSLEQNVAVTALSFNQRAGKIVFSTSEVLIGVVANRVNASVFDEFVTAL